MLLLDKANPYKTGDKGQKKNPRKRCRNLESLHLSRRVAQKSDKLYRVGFLPRQDAPFVVAGVH
jgi:hypothetical protein